MMGNRLGPRPGGWVHRSPATRPTMKGTMAMSDTATKTDDRATDADRAAVEARG